MSRGGALSYSYKRFDQFLKPVIPIEVMSAKGTFKTAALVDSGADNCVFEGTFGELLGIDIKSVPEQSIGGIGGEVKAYAHKVGIVVGGNTHNATVLFTYDMPLFAFQILGQMGFFDRYQVKFDYQESSVVLRRKQ